MMLSSFQGPSDFLLNNSLLSSNRSLSPQINFSSIRSDDNIHTHNNNSNNNNHNHNHNHNLNYSHNNNNNNSNNPFNSEFLFDSLTNVSNAGSNSTSSDENMYYIPNSSTVSNESFRESNLPPISNNTHNHNHNENKVGPPPPIKKTRVAVACEECHIAKKTCDGNRPCSRCINSNKPLDRCVDYKRKKTKSSSQDLVAPSENKSNSHSFQVIPPTWNASVGVFNSLFQLGSVDCNKFLLASSVTLEKLFSIYPHGKFPTIDTDSLQFFCSFSQQLTPSDFAKLLLHFGYTPNNLHSSPNDPEYFKYSKWNLPVNEIVYTFPVIPDEFQHDFRTSPTTCLNDTGITNFATICIGPPHYFDEPLLKALRSDKEIPIDKDNYIHFVKAGNSDILKYDQWVLVNRQFERLMGFTQADMRLFAISRGVTQTMLQIFDASTYFDAVIKTGGICGNHIEYQLNITAKSKWGHKLPVLLHKKSTPGLAYCVLTIIPTSFTDITLPYY